MIGRVRFITRKYPPAVGGMETYSIKIIEGLRQRDQALEIIALPGKSSGRGPGVLSLLRFGVTTAARLLFAREAQIVHVADLASWPFAWIASLRHPRSGIIVSVHGSDVSFAHRPGLRAKLYRGYLRLGAKRLKAAQLITNSNYIADLARSVGFRNVSVVPLATDFGYMGTSKKNRLLYAGRISPAKGLRFLIEKVLPLLPVEVHLRVAGTVWEESERPLLSQPRVDYLGTLSPDELAAEFVSSAAVLIPTRESEGFGLVAIEAAACGAWVIASRHSGLVDVVKPPIGVTVEADDVNAWAAAIGSALSRTTEVREKDALAARAEVDRHFRWSRVIDDTLAIYKACSSD